MRYSRILLLLLFAFNYLNSSSQSLPVEWTNTYKPQGKNSDRAACIRTDSHGNILVAGYAGRQFGYPDAFVIKYSPSGDTLWTYYYAGPIYEEDAALDLEVDANNNVYFSGFSNGVNYQDECIAVKLDSNGVQQWANRFSGPGGSESHGNAIAIDDSGNVYVAGYYKPPSASPLLLVIKYNPSGTVQWKDSSHTPSSTSDVAYDIAISPNGNATICGTNTGVGTGYNIFVKQYTRGGGTNWIDSYANPTYTGMDEGKALQFTINGELRVAGNTFNGTVEDQNVVVLSYSASGIRQWATIYTDATTPNDEFTNALSLDNAGNAFVAANEFRNQVIYRINADGSQGWKRSWTGPLTNGNDVAFDLAVDATGNVYAAGKGIYPGPNYSGNNGLDIFTVTKYSASGDSLWTYRQGSNTDISIGFAIAVKDNKVYATGFKSDTADQDQNLYTVILDTAGPVLAEWMYNGEGDAIIRGQFVRTDAQNNVYAAGTCDRLYYGSKYDVAVVKYDASGNELWNKVYTSYKWRNDTLTGMEIDASGNIILSISTDTGGTKTGYMLSLVKISPDGLALDTGWYIPSSGSLFANSMAVRNDGGVALGCNAGMFGASLFSFDSLLNLQWVAQIDTLLPLTTTLAGIDLFSNGDIAATGTIDTAGGNSRNIFVQRINSSGTRTWETILDSLNVRDESRDVTVSVSGDVAVAGFSGSVATAAKLDGNTGAITWKATYNPTTSTAEKGIKIRFTPAGSVAMLCDGYNGFVYRWYTVQFNGANGSQQWAMQYSNVASDRHPRELLVQPNGVVVTAGYQITGGTIPNYDYVLVGYSTTGVQQFLNTYSTPNIYPDRLHSLTADSQRNLIVTGESSSSFLNEYRYFMATVKYGYNPVGIEEQQAVANGLTIFPNPSSTGKFIFISENIKEDVTARVFDLTGRLIRHMNHLTSGSSIDLSAFTPGLYLVHLHDENRNYGSMKLIKE